MSQRIKDLQDISIAIDTWDDVFSDFDPRPFSERALSEDFLNELRKRHRETPGGRLTIVINAPHHLHDSDTEQIVLERIKFHFHRHAEQMRADIQRLRFRGLIFVLLGITFLGLLTYLTYFHALSSILLEVLGIVLMPLGWFGIWEGMSKIVDVSPVILQEESLAAKLAIADCRIEYFDEE